MFSEYLQQRALVMEGLYCKYREGFWLEPSEVGTSLLTPGVSYVFDLTVYPSFMFSYPSISIPPFLEFRIGK